MKLSKRQFLTGSAALAVASVTGCAHRPGQPSSYLTGFVDENNIDPVFYWMDIAFQSVRDQAIVPPMAARCMAMGPSAGFLAANAITGEYQSHIDVGPAPAGADPEIAYGVAFCIAAAEAFQQPFIFDRIRFLDMYPDGEQKDVSVAWGKQVGKQIVRLRTNDGSEPSRSNFYLGRYARREDALRWRPTGPFYDNSAPGPAFSSFDRGLLPGFGHIAPWTMTHSSQFRANNFLDPKSPEFADQFAKVKEIGSSGSKSRSDDETEFAVFWEDGPWGITPPGHFLLIAMQVLQYKPMSFTERARAFALLSMTQADAAISTWDSKYFHDIIRPETAIRYRAAQFGNSDPRMVTDASWKSLIPTPGFPAYTSGHSCFGAVGTHMTALLYGSDKVSFSGESPDQVLWPQLRGIRRNWTSLSQACDENGLSRICGGVHWDIDNVEGISAGRAIAQQAFDNLFPAAV